MRELNRSRGYESETRNRLGGYVQRDTSNRNYDHGMYNNQRRTLQIQNQERQWVPSYVYTCKDLLDRLVDTGIPAPGLIIKNLVNEIQKYSMISDQYTRFFLQYVVGEGKHAPIADATLYKLILNDNKNIIVKKYQPEVRETNTLPQFEKDARGLALYLYQQENNSGENWNDEIYDGNHDWTGKIHQSFLDRAKNILCGIPTDLSEEEVE